MSKRLGFSPGRINRDAKELISLCKNHNPSQIWNRIKYQLCKFKGFRTGYLKYDPLYLTLLITNRCNLNCSMCPWVNPSRLSNIFVKNDDMTIDEFKQIINRFSNAVQIEISGGEPFLHNNIFEMIDYTHKCKIKIKIPTNGTVIHNMLDRIVRSPISILNISLNALNSQEYVRLTGASEQVYNTLLKGISELLKERNKHNKKLRVTISFVCTKANYRNIPQMVGLAENIGVDEIIFFNLIPYGIPGFSEDQCLYNDDPEVIEVIKSVPSPKPNLEVVMPRLYKKEPIDKRCEFPFLRLPIDANGDVSSCGCHKAPPGNYGNVFTDKDAWNNSAFQRKREIFTNKSLPIPDYCKTCPNLVAERSPAYVPRRSGIR